MSVTADLRLRRSFPLAATAITVAALIAISLTPQFHDKTTSDAFFAVTLFGILFIPIYISPTRNLVGIFLLDSILVFLQYLILGVAPTLLSVLALSGISALVFLAIRRLISTGAERECLRSTLLPLFVSVAFVSVAGALLGLSAAMQPQTYDALLYRFDDSLGTQISFRVGRIVLGRHIVAFSAYVVYCALPLAIMLVYAQQLRRQGPIASRMLWSLTWAGPAGIVFYSLLPACGPSYFAGARFPLDPLTSQEAISLMLSGQLPVGFRNAFPSLHVAWALLAFWYSKGLSSFVRLCFFVFLILTAIAALGLGEHYFIDLVVAFPFALLIEALFANQIPLHSARRWQGIIGGLSILLAWIAWLRLSRVFTLPPLMVSWALMTATVVACLVLHRSLISGSTILFRANRNRG